VIVHQFWKNRKHDAVDVTTPAPVGVDVVDAPTAEDVARETRDIAVGLWRLVESLDTSAVDGDTRAEERRPIDENPMLAPGRFGDGPLGETCHGRR